MKKFVVAAAIVGSLFSQGAKAEQYQYLPEARLYLGGGYNPFYPREGYLKCVAHDGARPVDTNGAAQANVELSLVKSREELYKKLHFSMSLAGSYTFFSASSSLRIDAEDMVESDSLTWLVLFEQNYGRYVLENPRLKDEYKQYREAELYKSCGSEIVTEATKSALVYALVTVKHLDEAHKQDLEASFGGSMSGAAWSAQMNGRFQSLIQTAMEMSQVRVQIKAIGGKGITDLSDIIGSDAPGTVQSFINYGKIPQILNAYLKGMTVQNAVPTQFITTHISKFKPTISVNYTDFRSKQVEQIYSRYLEAEDTVRKITRLLVNDNQQAYIIDDKIYAALEATQEKYTGYLNSLSVAGEKCFDQGSKQCVVPSIKFERVHWPSINQSYICKLKRQETYNAGLVPSDLLEMADAHNLMPQIEYKNMQPILVGWEICKTSK